MPELHDLAGTVVSPKEYYDGPADETYRLIWGDNIHNTCPSRRYRSPRLHSGHLQGHGRSL